MRVTRGRHLSDSADLHAAVAQLQPDVIIIDTESPSRDTLEQICVMSRDDPRTILMFTHDGETEKIRAATKAGVSAYVVGGLDSKRLKPIMDAAMVRLRGIPGDAQRAGVNDDQADGTQGRGARQGNFG